MQKEKFNEWPLTDVFGICRQTILSVYRQPTFDSALITQLLFGECYQVISSSQDQLWYKIHHEATGLLGYISAKLINKISNSDYQSYLLPDFQVVTSPIAVIEFQGTNLYLLPGSRLHFSDMELFNWRDHIGFTGSVRSHAIPADRAEVIDIALKFVNSPYQAGGRSLFGIDEDQIFPLIFMIAGYTWDFNELPGKSVMPEEVTPGDLMIVAGSGDHNKKRFALYLGSEEVLWMDHRIRISDLEEWLSSSKNNTDQQVVLKSRNLIG